MSYNESPVDDIILLILLAIVVYAGAVRPFLGRKRSQLDYPVDPTAPARDGCVGLARQGFWYVSAGRSIADAVSRVCWGSPSAETWKFACGESLKASRRRRGVENDA